MKIVDGHFELEGKKFNIYSGTIHYFRIMPQYWRDRLLKLKACGFNTVETYVPWNMHEYKKGEFNFSGILDIEKFLDIAKDVGLYAIVRPGPYICAEWDLGGLPAWLIKQTSQVRCMNPIYLKHVEEYFTELFKHLVNHQYANGGNIIMMQVENEYGNYGNDHNYMVWLRDLMLKLGTTCLLCTSDDKSARGLSMGMVDDVFATVNFGSAAKDGFNNLELFQKNKPKMVMEFWCGWFDHWGEKHHKKKSKWIAKQVNDMLDMDVNFNFYVFHGGTNFGFTSGANQYLKYVPTITSYDYAAPITEWGDYTKTYYLVRDVMKQHLGQELPQLPPRPTFQNVGEVKLSPFASLLDNLDNIGTHYTSVNPEPMEHFNQNQGLIYYETSTKLRSNHVIMSLCDLHDYAYVYRDGIFEKKYDCRDKNLVSRLLKQPTHFLKKADKDMKLGILVDADGHINFGDHLCEKKGITKVVVFPATLFNYDVWTLPLDNLDLLKPSDSGRMPLFLRGSFKTNSKDDCFVHFDGFTKGVIYVNGFNLGRYNKVGPQKALYLPGCVLKEENEIIVLELEKYKKPVIIINDKPDLG